MLSCNKQELCKNFNIKHCIKYIHPFRERKCKYSPCKLLHDKNHLLQYAHHNQYQVITNDNLQYNKSHPIYIQDIFNIIHKYIIKDNYYEKINYNKNTSGPNLFLIINNLLLTSKIFKTLLNTDLNFVNTLSNNNNYSYTLTATTFCICNHVRCECNIICDEMCKKCNYRFIYCKCLIKCKDCNKNSYETESEDHDDYDY